MSKKTGEIIVIEWIDAVYINQHSDIGHPSTMVTTGILVKDYGDCLLIKNPKTEKKETGESHPKKQPVFYCIPRELILNIKEISK